MAAGITLCGSLSKFAVSFGAAMHNAGYLALGLDWHYVPFEVNDLAGALSGMRALGIRGFGVSMPFKLSIMPLLDALDPLAERIGAVNTVINDNGELSGHNTDWVGAARALEEVRPLAGARVLLLGAGGAARAIAFGLSEHGARLTIANRSDHKSAALAKEVSAAHRPWKARNQLADFDVLLNGSSCGMTGVNEDSPVDAGALRQELVVMDIVYKPLQTQLLRDATTCGCVAVHGGRMLLHQAARQFELYTGRDAPLEAMDAAMREQTTPSET
jgi:shikimate dehydrogenase